MRHEHKTLGALCAQLGLDCPAGKEAQVITGIAPLEEAGEGEMSYLTRTKYLAQAKASKASAILVPQGVSLSHSATLLPCANPYLTFAKYLQLIEQTTATAPSVDPTAIVDPAAALGNGVHIGAGAIVQGDVVVGDHCYIGAGAKLLNGTRLGQRVRIESGAVIASEGFGFAPDAQGHFHRIPQLGEVVLEDDVSIGANTTIDRATLGATKIGQGTKIDNLCQIGHNVVIGAHTVIAAQAGIAGSSTIGSHCQIGGQVGIVGHIEIGDFVNIQAQSGVAGSVPSNKSIFGSPAIDYRTYLKAYAVFKQNGEKK